MDSNQSLGMFNEITKKLELEILRTHSIIEFIGKELYQYDNKQKEFILKMNINSMLKLIIGIKEHIKNISDEEIKNIEEIIIENRGIDSIIENIRKYIEKKFINAMNAGILLDLRREVIAKSVKDTNTLKTINEALEEDFPKFKKILKLFISISIKNSIKVCKNQYSAYRKMIKNQHTAINSMDNIRMIVLYLNKTIKEALKDINSKNTINTAYKNIINEVLYIWTNAIFKEQPNNVYTAFNNSLKYHTIKDNKIDSLYIAIVTGHDTYCKLKNKYDTLISILVHFLDLNSYKDDNRLDSIKKLATANYNGKKIMDTRTFNKHTPYTTP